MTPVGPGAIEIRIHHPQEHRVIYVANFPEAVYILHCFGKKTQKTPTKDL
jgi:phage-related protein